MEAVWATVNMAPFPRHKPSETQSGGSERSQERGLLTETRRREADR